jgi:hypothetical protein
MMTRPLACIIVAGLAQRTRNRLGYQPLLTYTIQLLRSRPLSTLSAYCNLPALSLTQHPPTPSGPVYAQVAAAQDVFVTVVLSLKRAQWSMHCSMLVMPNTCWMSPSPLSAPQFTPHILRKTWFVPGGVYVVLSAPGHCTSIPAGESVAAGEGTAE